MACLAASHDLDLVIEGAGEQGGPTSKTSREAYGAVGRFYLNQERTQHIDTPAGSRLAILCPL